MKIGAKNMMGYIGFFLFALSIIASTSNEVAAIILLISSFGIFILGGLLKG